MMCLIHVLTGLNSQKHISNFVSEKIRRKVTGEVLDIITDVALRASNLLNYMQNMSKDQAMEKGLSFFDLKNLNLLKYITNLSTTILRKLKRKKIINHRIVKQLMELREIMERMWSKEDRRKYHLNKLVAHASSGNIDTNDPLKFRANSESLVAQEEEDDTDENDQIESEEDDDTNEDDQIDSEEEDDRDEKDEIESKIYGPPKISTVYYKYVLKRKRKTLEHAQKRAHSSRMLNELHQEYHTGSEEIKETLDPYKLKLSEELQVKNSRERFEEDYRSRSPVAKRPRVMERMWSKEDWRQYHINKYLAHASIGNIDTNDPLKFWANSESLVAQEEEDNTGGEDQIESEEKDDTGGEDQIQSEEEDDRDEKDEIESKIYGPPKISTVYYIEYVLKRKRKTLEHAQKRAHSSRMLNELHQEYHTGSEEIKETLDPYKLKLSEELQVKNSRERFEEDYRSRSPVAKRPRVMERMWSKEDWRQYHINKYLAHASIGNIDTNDPLKFWANSESLVAQEEEDNTGGEDQIESEEEDDTGGEDQIESEEEDDTGGEDLMEIKEDDTGGEDHIESEEEDEEWEDDFFYV